MLDKFMDGLKMTDGVDKKQVAISYALVAFVVARIL